MSFFERQFLFLLMLFGFVFNGLVKADDGDAQIDKFYLISTDDPSSGGCTPDQVQWIKSAYTEAMKMVRGAISDIDTFNAPQSKDNIGAQLQYAKVFSMLAQMFGIKTVDENGGPKDSSERGRLDTVRSVFDALQRNADGPIPQDPSKRKLIFCNADGITYLGNNERIPMGNQAGEPVSNLDVPNGVFFQPGKYDAHGNQVYPEMTIQAPEGGTPKVTDRFCRPGVAATTNRGSGRVFLCFSMISKHNIQPTAGPAVQRYHKINEYYSGSWLLIHEFVHLWRQIGDQLAVDMQPGLPSPRPRVTDPKALVYFFDRCYDLATSYPRETIQTADTFATFAVGQFFRDWMWVTVKQNGKYFKGMAWPITQQYSPPS